MILTRGQSATLVGGSLCLFLFTAALEWQSRQVERMELEALRHELHTTQARLSTMVRGLDIVAAQPCLVLTAPCWFAQAGEPAYSDVGTPCVDLADMIEEFGVGFCAAHKNLCDGNLNFRTDSCPKTCGACGTAGLHPGRIELPKHTSPVPMGNEAPPVQRHTDAPPLPVRSPNPPATAIPQTPHTKCDDEFDRQYGPGYCAMRVDYCSGHDDFRNQASPIRPSTQPVGATVFLWLIIDYVRFACAKMQHCCMTCRAAYAHGIHNPRLFCVDVMDTVAEYHDGYCSENTENCVQPAYSKQLCRKSCGGCK